MDPPGDNSATSDSLHTLVVLVGLGLMFGAVLFTVIFYGSGGETNAIAILGVFLPAVTGVVGFVYGIKTGKDAGTEAGDKLVSTTKKDVADSAKESIDLINALEPALDNVLSSIPAPAAPPKIRGLVRTPGIQAQDVDLASLREQYNRTLAELKGRLKQAAGIP